MTLLILTQPGAIIDICWERLIVAVICLNYSRARGTRGGGGGTASPGTTGGAATENLLVERIAPRSRCRRHCTLMWATGAGRRDWLWPHWHTAALAERAKLPSGWEVWLRASCRSRWPAIKSTICVCIRVTQICDLGVWMEINAFLTVL